MKRSTNKHSEKDVYKLPFYARVLAFLWRFTFPLWYPIIEFRDYLRYDRVEREKRNQLDMMEHDPALFYEHGLRHHDSQKRAHAAEQLLEIKPNHYEALLVLAEISLEKNDVGDAIKFLNRVVRDHDEEVFMNERDGIVIINEHRIVSALLKLGSVYYNRSDYLASFSYFLRIVYRENPHSHEALLGIGKIYFKYERYSEARGYFKKIESKLVSEIRSLEKWMIENIWKYQYENRFERSRYMYLESATRSGETVLDFIRILNESYLHMGQISALQNNMGEASQYFLKIMQPEDTTINCLCKLNKCYKLEKKVQKLQTYKEGLAQLFKHYATQPGFENLNLHPKLKKLVHE